MYDHTALMSHVDQDLLEGVAVFPTSFQLSLSIRSVLNRPNVHVADVARLIEAEPLVAAKLIALANSVAFNPLGREVYGVEQAINRVGFEATRSLAISVAVGQIRSMPSMLPYADITEAAWRRSVHAAALVRELARLEGGASPEQGMLCGLVSELGVFFLLHRAVGVPLYAHDRGMLKDLLRQHATKVRPALLGALGLPKEIVLALRPMAAPAGSEAMHLQAFVREALRLMAVPSPVPATEPRAEWLLSVKDRVDELRHAL
jgi:hypothetical protein